MWKNLAKLFANMAQIISFLIVFYHWFDFIFASASTIKCINHIIHYNESLIKIHELIDKNNRQCFFILIKLRCVIQITITWWLTVWIICLFHICFMAFDSCLLGYFEIKGDYIRKTIQFAFVVFNIFYILFCRWAFAFKKYIVCLRRWIVVFDWPSI